MSSLPGLGTKIPSSGAKLVECCWSVPVEITAEAHALLREASGALLGTESQAGRNFQLHKLPAGNALGGTPRVCCAPCCYPALKKDFRVPCQAGV